MKIEKLDIKGFGKFSNFTLNLVDGVNVIFGGNEAGKSTLQCFIKGMLYGLKGGRTSKDGLLPETKRYNPWNANDFGGSMEYKLDNGNKFRVGRNFGSNSVRVYDSFFNDITGSFEISRDKGVLFAEAQLGINETCFEKTVLIKQMDSRINEDGSKELLSRLTNISQTGFEDVSFRRAQEAIKDALKTCVGTDKTSTRPLDKVVARLEELYSLKTRIIKKRNSMFEMEYELTNAIINRDNLKKRKYVLSKIKDLFEMRKDVYVSNKKKYDLNEIFRNISSEEDELTKISSRTDELNKTKEEFGKFEAFSNEDIDAIGVQYFELKNINEANKKLQTELLRKKEEIAKIEEKLEPLKVFASVGDNIEAEVIELNRGLDLLKGEYKKNNVEILNERINSAQYRNKRAMFNIIFSVLLTLLFITAGYYSLPIGLAAGLLGSVITIILVLSRKHSSEELLKLLNQKKISFVSVNSIIEETNKKQKMLESILKKVRVSNIEEFLKLKSEYDNKTEQVMGLKRDMLFIEDDYNLNTKKNDSIKKELLHKLKTVGIIEAQEIEVTEEHIKNLKNGVRRLNGFLPSINYTIQRTSDLNKNISDNFKKASSICEKTIESIEEIIMEINRFTEIVNNKTEALRRKTYELKEQIFESSVPLPDYISLDEHIIDLEYEPVGILVNNEIIKTEEEFNELLLKIKEYETLLSSLSSEDEELQRVEEEFEELELRKNQLQDINVSLKTALEILTEASIEIQRDFAPALNKRMSEIIGRVTQGRYYDLKADDNLQLKAISPETGEVVGGASLSGGTLDQLYLALRIAMSDLVLPEKEKPPFIMDEVFAHYDDNRSRESLQFLKELSSSRQIIFFTCKRRELETMQDICGDKLNVVELN